MSETMADPVTERALWRLSVTKALMEAVPDVLDRYFHRDICILATRLGLEVLRYFNITDAYAQSVTCRVMNGEAVALLEAGREDDMWRLVKANTRDKPGGPWLMAVNTTEANDGRFPGHVGIVVPVDHPDLRAMFLDLTAQQFDRPHKGIELHPVTLQLEDEWFDEALPIEQPRTGVLINGAIIGYCPVPDHPGAASFTNSPDWKWPGGEGRRAIYRRVTGEAIRATRDQLTRNVRSATSP